MSPNIYNLDFTWLLSSSIVESIVANTLTCHRRVAKS